MSDLDPVEVVVPAPTPIAGPSYHDLVARQMVLRAAMGQLDLWFLEHKPPKGGLPGPLRRQLEQQRQDKVNERTRILTELSLVKLEVRRRADEADDVAPIEWEHRKAPRSMGPNELTMAIAVQRRMVQYIKQMARREQIYLSELERQGDRTGLGTFKEGPEEVAFRGPGWKPDPLPDTYETLHTGYDEGKLRT